jgi:hypothetical protein
MSEKESIDYSDFDDADNVIAMLYALQSDDQDQRERAREAMLFVNKRDGQWEPYWWNMCDGKPRYTFDNTTPIVNQVAGEINSAAFDIVVSPGSGEASEDDAEIYDGLIRTIENLSGAKYIYAAATRGMIIAGFDCVQIEQKYVDSDSFDQDLVITKVADPIDRVWFDPGSVEPDGSDARFAFLLHPVSCTEYASRWPKGLEQSLSDGAYAQAYYSKPETITVGQVFYLVERDRELVQMSNGAVYADDEEFQSLVDDMATQGITEVRRRKRKEVVQYTRFFDAGGWLEKGQETVFNTISLVPLYGNHQVIENKVVYMGVVEKLIDPQRVLNYAKSREIEEGALAPRGKYWMTRKMAEGEESDLETLNVNNKPVAFFNADPEFPGPPIWQGGAQINPGLNQISADMQQMIGHTSSLFAANMGDNPGLQSGIAIEKLQNKGDNGTQIYHEAVEIMHARLGRVLVPAISKVYDTARQVQLTYEDGTNEIKTINKPMIDMQTGQLVTLHDLSKGHYNVICRSGPSFRNRQQETIEFMLEAGKVDPSIIQMGGDILLNAIQAPGARALAERKRAMLLQQGVIPESQMNDEEKAMMQAKAQQPQPPSPEMVLAMAEQSKAEAEKMNAQVNLMKAQTDQMNAQIKYFEVQSRVQNDDVKNQIDIYDVQTKRYVAETNAEVADVKINIDRRFDQLDATGKQLDNLKKVKELSQPAQQPSN